MRRGAQTAVGAGALALGALIVAGAVSIPSAAGYAGVGPDFLPWVVGLALLACGALLLREARSGGFRRMEEPSGAARADWPAFAWVSGGILLNAALITTIGFILSCALCFALAARGFRRAEGQAGGAAGWLRDAATGLAIAAPVYWMFTQLLAINLPGLTATGWL